MSSTLSYTRDEFYVESYATGYGLHPEHRGVAPGECSQTILLFKLEGVNYLFVSFQVSRCHTNRKPYLGVKFEQKQS